jgi:prepilin peptidase CpaA
MAPAQIALWTFLAAALLISAITDIVASRILNAVTVPTLVIVLALRLWDSGVEGLVAGGLGAVIAAVPFAAAAWFRKMGWGDVKLMAAVGAALGHPLVLAAVLFISLVGALQAALFLVWHGVGSKPGAPARAIPYAVAIAVGTVWAVWWQWSGH